MSQVGNKEHISKLEETLKLKRTPVDTWNLREQLALALAVVDLGIQDWSSVARTLKHQIKDEDRPPDWYSPKNCALQYNRLLEMVDKPARKKRAHSGQGDSAKTEKVETHEEAIVRHLKSLRIQQLKLTIEQETAIIKVIETDLSKLRNPDIADDEILRMEDDVKRELEEQEEREVAKEKWLQEREEKKRSLQLKLRSLHSVSASKIIEMKDDGSGSPPIRTEEKSSKAPQDVEVTEKQKVESQTENVPVHQTPELDDRTMESTKTESVKELSGKIEIFDKLSEDHVESTDVDMSVDTTEDNDAQKVVDEEEKVDTRCDKDTGPEDSTATIEQLNPDPHVDMDSHIDEDNVKSAETSAGNLSVDLPAAHDAPEIVQDQEQVSSIEDEGSTCPEDVGVASEPEHEVEIHLNSSDRRQKNTEQQLDADAKPVETSTEVVAEESNEIKLETQNITEQTLNESEKGESPPQNDVIGSAAESLEPKEEVDQSVDASVLSPREGTADLANEPQDEKTSSEVTETELLGTEVKKETHIRTYSKKSDWSEDDVASAANSSESLSTSEEDSEIDAAKLVRERSESSCTRQPQVPEESEKLAKEWRRQALAVMNNAKFHRTVSKLFENATTETFQSVLKLPQTLSSIKREIEFRQIRTVDELRVNVARMIAGLAFSFCSDDAVYDEVKGSYAYFDGLVRDLIVSRGFQKEKNLKRNSLANHDSPQAKKRRRK